MDLITRFIIDLNSGHVRTLLLLNESFKLWNLTKPGPGRFGEQLKTKIERTSYGPNNVIFSIFQICILFIYISLESEPWKETIVNGNTPLIDHTIGFPLTCCRLFGVLDLPVWKELGLVDLCVLEEFGVVDLLDKDPERNICESGTDAGETDLLSGLEIKHC